MGGLYIEQWPSQVLTKPSQVLKEVDADVLELISLMVLTMGAVNGVGLSANQVGSLIRLAVIKKDKEILTLINPEIISMEGSISMEEGCLSLIGVTAEVKRATSVVVSALDTNMCPFKFSAKGLLARIIQHEIDHLNGKMFFDNLSRLRRELFVRKINKKKEEK